MGASDPGGTTVTSVEGGAGDVAGGTTVAGASASRP